MTAFKTKREAISFANRRKNGFRSLAMREKDKNRKRFLLGTAIKSVKIRRVKKRHWSSPLYFVEGM